MAKRSDRNLLVGLDIGTSKVVAIVGEVKADGALEIIGVGSHPSRGLKKGVVVNIESTVQSIQRAVEEAELMAGCEIHSVYAGIAGSHVRSLNSHGAIRPTAVIPIAGDQVTNDIAVSMRTPTQYAEDIKIRYACALSQLANPDESIEVPSGGDRPPPRLPPQTLPAL